MMRMVGLISGLFGVQLHGHGVLRGIDHIGLCLRSSRTGAHGAYFLGNCVLHGDHVCELQQQDQRGCTRGSY